MPEKVDEIEKIFGYIDILINNGGVSVRSDVLSTAMDVDIKVMLVNYFGSVALTKGASTFFALRNFFASFCVRISILNFPAALPTMLKRKEGLVVCVSSVQGKFSLPHRSAYSASKHAMQAFCDSLRAEVAEHNVKVLCVSPGYINTALSLNALTGSGRNYGSKWISLKFNIFPLRNLNQFLSLTQWPMQPQQAAQVPKVLQTISARRFWEMKRTSYWHPFYHRPFSGFDSCSRAFIFGSWRNERVKWPKTKTINKIKYSKDRISISAWK